MTYVCAILDDVSQFILAGTLYTNMDSADLLQSLYLAIAKTGIDEVKIRH
jgi:hypothetical protein